MRPSTMEHIISNAVGRRISKAIKEYSDGDYESSLLQLFPAFDATAKKRYPALRNKARMMKFAHDQEWVILGIGQGDPNPMPAIAHWSADTEAEPVDLPKNIYEFARCTLLHEGELDGRIVITDNAFYLATGDGRLHLDKGFILGMIVAVMIAPENKDQTLNEPYAVPLFGVHDNGCNLWGAENNMIAWFNKMFA